MNRRDLLAAATAAIFVPKFGRWYPQGSGVLVRDSVIYQRHVGEHFVGTTYRLTIDCDDKLGGAKFAGYLPNAAAFDWVEVARTGKHTRQAVLRYKGNIVHRLPEVGA